MSSDEHLVFVYGTLKRGGRYHHLLQKNGAIFLGRARTKERFIMYEKGGIPFVSRKRAVCEILGEVYLVDTNTLMKLDQLEEHPYWYRRERAQVIMGDGKRLDAYIYFNEKESGRVVTSGNFSV